MAQSITLPRAVAPLNNNPDEFSTFGETSTAAHQHALRTVCIPAPRARIAARIDDFARLIGGGSNPLYCGARGLLVGARLQRARMIILGTACRRPLLSAEARDLQAITGDHIVVLRLVDGCDRPASFTCDFIRAVAGECVETLSPWILPHGRSLWLAPVDRSGLWIRLFADGPQFRGAPSVTEAEMQRGFDRAQAMLPASGPGLHHG